jgi:hypothetical protein
MTSAVTSPSLRGIDWDDDNQVTATAERFFAGMCADGYLELRRQLENLTGNPGLLLLCERLDFMDKLVVWTNEDASIRLRVHLFRPGYADRPHNHRFTFASHVLCGSYRHHLYGHESLLENADHMWRPLITRNEGAGSQYVMHHDAVHAVAAVEPTLSLVLRGPTVKANSLIMDRTTGQRTMVVSAALEVPERRAAKSMSPDAVAGTVTVALAMLARSPR